MKIALSGLSGVGTSATARLVATQLGLAMSNFTFRDLAKERGVTFETLQKQAEDDFRIDKELDQRLIRFAQENPNCLIATDLACWLGQPGIYKTLGLEEGISYNYKIWLEAPLEVRAQRLQEREGQDLELVKIYNNQRDHDNRERYKKLYGVDIFDHDGVDWVFNTTHLSLAQVADQLVERLRYLDSKT